LKNDPRSTKVGAGVGAAVLAGLLAWFVYRRRS
jgi:MYXO-CTERM domain-containing protein